MADQTDCHDCGGHGTVLVENHGPQESTCQWCHGTGAEPDDDEEVCVNEAATAPADAGDEALVDGLIRAPERHIATSRAVLMRRLASLRARAERAERNGDEATVRADRWSAMFGELKRTWDAEMDARAMVRGRLAHAGETFPEFVERMAAERDAARSALAECQRERDAERARVDRAKALGEAIAAEARGAIEEAKRLTASLSRATERGERLAEEMRVALAKLREIPFAATQVFATVAYATCVLGEALADDARDAAGGEDGNG